MEDLKKRISERDRLDETRAISPLKKANDAVLIDSTQMSIQEVAETILSLAKKEKMCIRDRFTNMPMVP